MFLLNKDHVRPDGYNLISLNSYYNIYIFVLLTLASVQTKYMYIILLRNLGIAIGNMPWTHHYIAQHFQLKFSFS